MKIARLLLTLALVLAPVTALMGQAAGSDSRDWEIVVLYRPGFIAGLQTEHAVFEHVAPWVSVRYGTHNAVCALSVFGTDCGAHGLTALAGVRLWAGPWGAFEPYLTLGVGRFWRQNDNRFGRGSDYSEATGTAHVGVVWLKFGRIRPRIEFGYESHISPWFNVGVGLKL